MASGDQILSGGSADWGPGYKPGAVHVWKALDGVTATDDGVWIKVVGAKAMSGQIVSTGVTSGGTVQVRGYLPTSSTDEPANSEDGFQIGNDYSVTANGNIDFAPLAGGQSIFYIKVMTSAYTDGTHSAYLYVQY